MISQVLLVALLASAQGNVAQARTNYSKCLSKVLTADAKAGVEPSAFETKVVGECKAEEAAFRAASVASDVAAKIARATAEKNAEEEVGYIRENIVETYKVHMEPRPPK
ncbi:MAG TPA: hypothetical protein VGB59_10305 [Allosphingosinicella sp.]|jgi:hypothetical protein